MFKGEILFRVVHAGEQVSCEFSGSAPQIGHEISRLADLCGCDCCLPRFYGADEHGNECSIYVTTVTHPLGAGTVLVKPAGETPYIATVL